jgi:hypothetical protein
MADEVEHRNIARSARCVGRLKITPRHFAQNNAIGRYAQNNASGRLAQNSATGRYAQNNATARYEYGGI